MADKINNIGKLFYKDYYEEVNFANVIDGKESNLGDINERIKNSDLVKIPYPIDDTNIKCIKVTIQYPGLITGVGLEHNSKNIKGAYNLGMHFDYTYGMPIVYGSSVKGVLREYFKEFYKGDLDVADLVEDIFSGKVRNKEKDKNDKGKLVRGYDNKSIYDRDVFFDAVIVKDYKGRFLEDDSITPHPDPLKNPTPIKMLKIAPGCKIEFRFRLVDSKGFTKDEKLKLFEEILATVGVGAKTNVGYGQLKIEKK